MKPFTSFTSTFDLGKVLQLIFIRTFPVWIGMYSAMALADVTSDIEALIQNKQWAQANLLIQSEFNKSPSASQSPQWRLLNSQVLAGLGKSQEAISELQLLIQEFPELPEPYNNLGVLLASQGNYEAASAALLSAIQARPHYKIAIQNLGDLYSAMAQQAYAKAKALAEDKSWLTPPKPAASVTTTTNTRTLR